MAKKKAKRKTKRKPKPKLTVKQKRFIQEYCVDFNATQAAIRSGYSEDSASNIGWENVRKPEIRDAVRKRLLECEEDADVTRARLRNEAKIVAFSDVGNFEVDADGKLQVVEGVPQSARRAVSSSKFKLYSDEHGSPKAEVEIKLWSKPEALRLAMQHFGMLIPSESLEVADPEVYARILRFGRQPPPHPPSDDDKE